MAERKNKSSKLPIESYEHKDKQRVNNPPIGMVTPETDPEIKKGHYCFHSSLCPESRQGLKSLI